jgi:hypothetical protein
MLADASSFDEANLSDDTEIGPEYDAAMKFK